MCCVDYMRERDQGESVRNASGDSDHAMVENRSVAEVAVTGT